MNKPKHWMKLLVEQQDKLWSKCNRTRGPLSTDCWEWTGAVDKDGYGKHSIVNRWGEKPIQKWIRSHQAAYALAHGEFAPRGMVIMHLCNNKSCCNPKHLRLGTVSENKVHHDRTVEAERNRRRRG